MLKADWFFLIFIMHQEELMASYQVPQPPLNEEEILRFCNQVCNYLEIIEARISVIEGILGI